MRRRHFDRCGLFDRLLRKRPRIAAAEGPAATSIEPDQDAAGHRCVAPLRDLQHPAHNSGMTSAAIEATRSAASRSAHVRGGTPRRPGYSRASGTDHAEVTHLFRDLLIRVTSFFRDQETFETRRQGDPGALRWVGTCGCHRAGLGVACEEAYSLAILLRGTSLDSLKGAPKVPLSRTVDEPAIATTGSAVIRKAWLRDRPRSGANDRIRTASHCMMICDLCTLLRSTTSSAILRFRS